MAVVGTGNGGGGTFFRFAISLTAGHQYQKMAVVSDIAGDVGRQHVCPHVTRSFLPTLGPVRMTMLLGVWEVVVLILLLLQIYEVAPIAV